ncbi:MAG: LacI family DNA-binding transcriptional regulator [Chloroflexota bacterium]
MKQKVTIADVAKAAGVSKQTVSRAINDKGEISPDTKERIMLIIEQLGYRPSRLARAMNTQRSQMVGLVVGDITNPFFPEVARGVQDAAMDRDYNVLVCNTDDKPALATAVTESLISQGVDGIITFWNQSDKSTLLSLGDSFGPILSINTIVEHPQIDNLLVDNASGATLAVDYFVNNNHEHIGMLTNSINQTTLVRRVQGFQQAIADHNLNPNYIVEHPATLAGGYEAAKTLLNKYPQISAIFTYNDLMGLGAIRACLDAGRKIPDDISIIGFDDIQLSAMYTPSLSTIRVDKYEMGRLAFERIFTRIEQPDHHYSPLHMGVELILRESTKSITT